MKRIAEYATANYPSRFTKRKFTLGAQGKKIWKTIAIEPIVTEYDNFWYVQNHKDASGIVLSKNL